MVFAIRLRIASVKICPSKNAFEKQQIKPLDKVKYPRFFFVIQIGFIYKKNNSKQAHFMTHSKNIFALLLMLLSATFLVNCSSNSSSDDEPEPCNMATPEITTNSPVTSGNNIQLETPFLSTMAEYHWTGPNGFVSNQQNPTVMASTASAGVYTLVIDEGACTSPTASVNVVVTPATAPCNPTNNTATNSVFPTMTFNSVLHRVALDQYEIDASGSNGDLTIFFANANAPTAGVYEICSDCPTSFLNPNQVCISIVTGGTFSYLYRAHSGSVYISYINGKISATFCGLTFSGEGTTFTSSSKVTTSN